MYFLFLLKFFVCGRLYISNFESYSSDLYDVAFRQPMTFEPFVGIVGILDDLPEHALGILEEVLVLDQVLMLIKVFDSIALILRDL